MTTEALALLYVTCAMYNLSKVSHTNYVQL